MIKKAICSHCSKEYLQSDYEYDTYLLKCVIHEISHLCIEELFTANLKESLLFLDTKYNTISSYNTFSWDISYGSYDSCDEIIYKFNLINDRFTEQDIKFNVGIENVKEIPSINHIIKKIEKYYQANIKKMYDGIVKYEGWCGGYNSCP